MKRFHTAVLTLVMAATSSTSALAIDFPIKVNTNRPSHSSGTLNYDCAGAPSFVKPVDTRRDLDFTSLSTSRRNQFHNALVAATTPIPGTSSQANINFNVQADAWTGKVMVDNDGDIGMTWSGCIDLEVVKLSNGDNRRLTFYWNELTPGLPIDESHPCYHGEAGPFQQYEEIVTDLSGFVFLSHTAVAAPATTMISDDVTLGGALVDANLSGLPISGGFVTHMSFLEAAAAEDAVVDRDSDGAINQQMAFLFSHYLTAVALGATPATELLDYRIQLGLIGTVTAMCSATAGAGEQGHVEIDTEQAFLSFQ